MPTIFVAGSGGHLTQLDLLAPRLGSSDGDLWISDETAQTTSLLHARQHAFVPHSAPRQFGRVLANATPIMGHIRRLGGRTAGVTLVSTGAGIALSAALAALLTGTRMVYIESATRVSEFSLTGKLLGRVPGVRRFVQHEQMVNKRWSYRGSVFDGFETIQSEVSGDERLRVFVTVGANRHIGYRALIEAVDRIALEDWDVFYQTGPTDVADLPIAFQPTLSSQEMQRQMELADVVIAHAGTGTALIALAAGRVPILVPRTAASGQHVDDHQLDLARMLSSRGLAVIGSPEELSEFQVRDVARRRAVRSQQVNAFSY